MAWTSQYQFGHDALGPIMNAYLHRLHAYLLQCGGQNQKVLFALRAGLRIYNLYDAWLQAKGLAMPDNVALLKASRMMGVKAAYARAPAVALSALGNELGVADLNQYISALMRPAFEAGTYTKPPAVQTVPIHEFLGGEGKVARLVDDYLRQQSELYEQYLQELVGDAERLIVVDSGWKGSTQLLLEAAFPERNWEGVYFGCIGRAEAMDQRVGTMHGLMFDSEQYDPNEPETCFLVHRHLIEGFLEPGIKSVEQVEAEDVGAKLNAADLLKAETKEPWDQAYDAPPPTFTTMRPTVSRVLCATTRMRSSTCRACCAIRSQMKCPMPLANAVLMMWDVTAARMSSCHRTRALTVIRRGNASNRRYGKRVRPHWNTKTMNAEPNKTGCWTRSAMSPGPSISWHPPMPRPTRMSRDPDGWP